MSVFFLYPALLFGLFAASLPILIHLLTRRKLKRIQFPAVRFILLSQKRISRSYRLRHWILLALRTLAVVFLALLLANPIFQIGAGLFAGSGPVSLVVLLDNSLSMTWSGDGNGFRQAKDAARLLISGLNDGDRAALIPTNIDGKEPFRLKAQKDVLLKELDGIEIADGTANLPAALSKAYELLVEPAGQKEIRLITDMGLTGWDQFSVAGLKQVDPSIAFKLIHIGRKQQPLNGTIKTIRLTSQGVGVNLPTQIEATVANFGASEIKDVLVQLSIDGQNREQKLATVPAGGETSVNFQTRVNQAGAHVGQVTLKKDGLAGNPTTHFALDAQDKLKILVVDGDPQTSLVQSETFFLSRALNPAGDSSLFLPTVILPDALNSATLDGYQVVMLCNVAALSDAFVTKLQNFLRQGGGVLIFGGDKFQPESYSQRWPQALPGELREKKLGPEASGEKIGKFDLDHPVLQNLSEDTLQESLKSARVWGYTRTAASGKAALISLTNGDPLLLEQKIGSGKLMLFTTSADRDWSDLPVKTVYLPLVQALAQYLAGGKRGALDAGIPVGTAKELSLPPGYVGKSLRVTKPDKQSADIPIAGEKDHAQATIEVNDRAGIYRLAYPTGTEKDIGAPQLYSANSPFLESRLDEISARELQSKLSPIRAEVIPVDALKDGGSRTDLALPVLALLIVTLLIEGWLAQRF
jgi:hypothetical protein